MNNTFACLHFTRSRTFKKFYLKWKADISRVQQVFTLYLSIQLDYQGYSPHQLFPSHFLISGLGSQEPITRWWAPGSTPCMWHRQFRTRRKAGNQAKRNLSWSRYFFLVSDWFITNKRLLVIGQFCTPGIFNRSSIDSSYISLSDITQCSTREM